MKIILRALKWVFVSLLGLCLSATLIDRFARWYFARPVRVYVVSEERDFVSARVSAGWFRSSDWLEPVCATDPLGTLENQFLSGALFRGLDVERFGWSRNWKLWLRVEGTSFPTFAGPVPDDGRVWVGTHDVTGVVTVRGCKGPFEVSAKPPSAPFCAWEQPPLFSSSPEVKTLTEADGTFLLRGLLHLPYRVSARTCRGDPEVRLNPEASTVAVVLD